MKGTNGKPTTEPRTSKEVRSPKSEADADVPVSRFGSLSGFEPRPSDFIIWQLADSAFPTGGFAHSAGLEAAWQHDEVRNRADLVGYLEAQLHQVARAALPLVAAAHDEPERLPELDQLCDAFLSNHVANRASRLQGRAFLTAAERIRPAADLPPSPPPALAHFAPTFGACLGRLGIGRETALRLFVFNHLRGLLAAAVRLNIVGPMEGQKLQYQFATLSEEATQLGGSLTLDNLAQTSPLLDLWQGAQDRLYSRLFQS